MRKRRLVTGLVALLVVGVGVVALVYPVITAAVCPGCYGLSKAAPGIYVGGGAAGPATDMIAAARKRVADYLGPLQSDPRFLLCLDKDCYRRIGGGGEKGKTLRQNVIALSPDGVNETIASHELTHAELHERLKDYEEVPSWFHEGFAVTLSRDSRYLPCPVDPAGAAQRVRERTSQGQDFYRDSACVVDKWVTDHGGKTAVLDMIRRLNAGDSFTAIVAIPS